jgi:hypothetical protein
MATDKAPKPKMTDAERHKGFEAMAREVEAEEGPEAFDKAFKRVTNAPHSKRRASARIPRS